MFIDEKLPTDISYGMSGGPCFETEIVETHSGAEYRNIRTPYGRNKYNIVSGIKTKEQLDEVMSFFRAAKGRAIGFRFKDWMDFGAKQQFLGWGDGKNQKFQLVKIYSKGLTTEIRKITRPVLKTEKIFINGKRTRLYKLNCDTGELHFARPPIKGSKIEADFEFDVPVRFNTDQLSASMENYGVHSFDNIELIELVE
jgi:uncharacterized protein (TIGR02217 family)